MRIIYILSGTRETDGSTKSFMRLLEGVLPKGFNVLVVTPNQKGIFQVLRNRILNGNIQNLQVVDIDYTYYQYPDLKTVKNILLWVPRMIMRYLRNRNATSRLYRLAEKFRPDIIHTNTSVNTIGYEVGKRLNVPHIWHIREYGDKDFMIKVPFHHKKLTGKNNYCICITKDIAKYKQIFNRETTKVIYNGIVDKEKFRLSNHSNKYFLYAGRVTEKKGFFELLRGYVDYVRLMEMDSIPLFVAGECLPENRIILENIIKRDKSEKFIKILGERSDIENLMYGATATIIPSFSEGFGRVLPEAMANGSLTIGKDTAGTKEQYDNGVELKGEEIGLRYKTQEELTQLLVQVSGTTKENYIDMIRRSQSVVGSLYSTSTYVEEVCNLYAKVIK